MDGLNLIFQLQKKISETQDSISNGLITGGVDSMGKI